MQTSEINLHNKVRNKKGRLEYFFKGFELSCMNAYLQSNIILRAECWGEDRIARWSELDLSNYFYMKNGKIKSY